MESIEAVNKALFLQINAGSDTPAWLIDWATFIAEDLIYLIPTFLVVLWLWGDERWRNLALKVCAVTLFALGLNLVIGVIWSHPRPFMLGIGHLWLPHAADSSFPSDHATVFACIGIGLLFGGESTFAAVVLLVGLCVAWARVYLGVHFPLDMLGAVLIAAASYAVVTPLWRIVGNTWITVAQRLYRVVMKPLIARRWVRP